MQAPDPPGEPRPTVSPSCLTGSECGPGPNAILTSLDVAAGRELVLRRGCAANHSAATAPGGGARRPLNWVLPPTEPFPKADACKADENSEALCAALRRVAINREVLAAVSNKNIHSMLGTFIAGARLANITNLVVVALDEPTDKFVKEQKAESYLRKLVARGGSTDNHATSGLKFAVLKEFVAVGCSVLLSDVDVLWAQNPFTLPSLYRDSDVEGMSDGWDERTAFGYRWRNDGGAAASLRLSARNSGLFFLSATEEVHRMMVRLKGRMERESVWDQTAYNEEQWYVALHGAAAHGLSTRVMHYYCHMNSKVYFRFMRYDAELLRRHRPVSVHVNYHPEKLPRMEDVFERYHGVQPGVSLGGGAGKPTPRSADGGVHAWHWGVGLLKGKWCREAKRLRSGQGLEGSPLAQKLVQATQGSKVIKWAGIKGLGFRPGGALQTPWGGGTWGRMEVVGPGGAELYADFMGQQHVLADAGWPTVRSTRCGDLENVTITVEV